MIERDDSEILDAVPVPVECELASADIVPHAAAPLVQTAAAAAGGFVAGAAVLGLVHRRRHRRAVTMAARRGRGRGRIKAVGEVVEIVASRSLLVDVHILGTPAPSARGR